MVGVILSFFLSMILTRLLGLEQFGIYIYIYALISLLVMPSQFGVTTLIIRETAHADVNGKWGLMKGIWRWSTKISITMSIVTIIGAGLYFQLIHDSTSELTTELFFYGSLLIPLIALSNLRGAALQGLRKTVQGQLPENVFRPLFFICMVFVFFLAYGKAMTAQTALILNVIATFLAFIIGAWLLKREVPAMLLTKPKLEYRHKEWCKSILPLSLLEGVGVINAQADIIMLGIFGTVEDVALYRIGSQGAMITTLGLSAIAIAAMPYFARFHAKNELYKLSRVATNCARGSLLLAVPALVFFVLFGKDILSFLFGPEFSAGYVALIILSTVQLINAAFGTSGRILNMSGYERDTLLGMILATIINVVLNYMLIPLYGISGAAVATGVSILIKNIMLWGMVYIRLGIDSSFIGLPIKSKE